MKELGAALRLVEDDVPERMEVLASSPTSLRLLERIQELNSHKDASEIPSILVQMEQELDSGKALDILLATNMISVGVDVDRLGLMVVQGQPKGTSEYIQATSRVGRKHPGLIVTMYNWARPRDLSHYERFRSYHAMAYRYVEPTSVTPFSARARDRGLRAILIGMARLTERVLARNKDAGQMSPSQQTMAQAVSAIRNRVALLDPSEMKDVESELSAALDWWFDMAQRYRTDLKFARSFYETEEEAKHVLLRHVGEDDNEAYLAPDSLRDVEDESRLYYSRGGRAAMNKGPGSLRPSQIITSFGPGSIVDLSRDSVMILGTDSWRGGEVIYDHRLQEHLGVDEFRVPGTGKREGIPVTSFPFWRVCPRCGALSSRFPRPPGKPVPICDRCSAGPETHPARFIMTCDKGHISDFPWIGWAHRRSKSCSEPLLVLRTKGHTGALSDMEVVCVSCQARESMFGALGPKGLTALLTECPGRRPWLATSEPNCNGQLRGLQRGASNAYFPSIQSGLTIPPYVSPIQRALDRHWTTIKALDERSPEKVESVVSALFPDHSSVDIMREVRHRLSRDNKSDLREEEWQRLTSAGPGVVDKDFDARKGFLPPEYTKWIEQLVLVRRLREVRVLRGFTRVAPPDPEDKDRKRLAPLAGSKLEWLPAVEVRGEGLFFQLKMTAVANWEKAARAHPRVKSMLKAYGDWRDSLGWPKVDDISPRTILIHTFAHLLIRQLSLDAGYSSASIRERLYSNETMCGVLLYTAAPGADGSLGGLVQQGEPVRLQVLIDGALESAGLCSSDPLCREHKPSPLTGVNGAACHACTLAPETACERSNRLLDRACVTDLPEVTGLGFFSRDWTNV